MPSCEFQELVSRGECAIKTNDTSTGIRLLEKALILGTDDQPMLAALHSQLGNAYFASRDYKQAKFYHMSDMNMSRQLKDRVQEAKASSNLSATCAMLFEFENAIDCAKKVVEIGRELGDEPLECRGHYNLGLAYLQCAIHETNGASRHLKRENMMRALDAFQQHLSIAQKHQDRCFCGLSLGNIANTHYYLGDYQKSVDFHEKRLAIATQLDDKASIRRTLANIARAQTLLGEYESARDNYRAALNLAKEMGSPVEVLAQLRYDLNNVTSLIEQLDRQSNVSPRSCGPKIYCETGTNTSNSFGDSPRAYKSMNNLAIFEPPKQKKLSFDGGSMDKEAFFEMVSRMQGKRIDEQCAEFPLSDSQSVNNLDIANSSSSTTSRRGFTLSYKSTKNMVHNMKGGTMKSWTNLKGVFGSGSSSNNSRRRKQKQGTRTADFTEENARESPSPSCRDRDHSAGSSAKNSNVSRNTTK